MRHPHATQPSFLSSSRRLTCLLGLGALAALCAGPATAKTRRQEAPRAEAIAPIVNKKKVEIVFAIDTTGSMGGLLDAAKRKVWFIANEVLKAKQKPDLRIGLVAFRDKGDAYVTQALPLTSDLDQVYETLMGYQAGGGGDGPEHVNAALDHAVHKMQWTEGKDVLKLVFLVGDAPPHMDYDDDVKHTTSSLHAIRRNIYINTIQCGSNSAATTAFRTIALNSEGRFAAIAQDGGVVAMKTPFDKKLAVLAKDLDATRMVYGSKSKKASRKRSYARAESMAARSAPSVMADRASAKGKMGTSRDDDFLAYAAEAPIDEALSSIASTDLPDELAGKSKSEQKKILREKKAKRSALQKEIAGFSKKRDAYIAAEHAKTKKAPSGFDAEVIDMLHAEATRAGIEY